MPNFIVSKPSVSIYVCHNWDASVVRERDDDLALDFTFADFHVDVKVDLFNAFLESTVLVVVEPLEVQDKNRWQFLDQGTLGGINLIERK